MAARGPVFTDERGRRLPRVIGVTRVLAVLLVAGVAALVVSVMGGVTMPLVSQPAQPAPHHAQALPAPRHPASPTGPSLATGGGAGSVPSPTATAGRSGVVVPAALASSPLTSAAPTPSSPATTATSSPTSVLPSPTAVTHGHSTITAKPHPTHP